ncbi:MAG TPA: VUT family protein [Solirubrobacteraceae bacterium]|nr:VUT family protein [Solirubrobacteraceae bacterium]
MRRAATVATLVGAFLAAIVAANLALTAWGPGAIIPNAFFLIGLDLITRDRLADFWGTTRWAKMLALIAAGGALSWWLNRHAATIAEASAVSFAAAEVMEAVAYHALRRQRWSDRAPKAALFGAAVDSALFPTLAFGGFALSVSFGQFAAKVAGAVVWTWLVARLLPPPSVAPENS